MKLYFSPSTSSLATHIALIEAGASFELVPTLLPKEQQKAAAYLALNPEGKVPTLITEAGKQLAVNPRQRAPIHLHQRHLRCAHVYIGQLVARACVI